MFGLLGILLTELKLFGLPIRSPVLSLVQFNRRYVAQVIGITVVVVAYLLAVAGELSFEFEKGNQIIFAIITLGAFAAVHRPFVIRTDRLERTVGVILFVFLVLAITQRFMTLSWTVDLFVLQPDKMRGSATGLSSEPSFFAWMAGYFFVISQLARPGVRQLGYVVMFAVVLLTATLTSLVIIMIYWAMLGLCSVTMHGRQASLGLMLTLVFAVPLFVDLVLISFSGSGIGVFTLEQFNSWREVSYFSAIYGAELIGPFSGGDNWSDAIYAGQSFQSAGSLNFAWLAYPWSLSSMWLCELGVIPTILLVALLWNIFARGYLHAIEPGDHRARAVACALFVMGVFLAPKWCVYYLLNPYRRVA